MAGSIRTATTFDFAALCFLTTVCSLISRRHSTRSPQAVCTARGEARRQTRGLYAESQRLEQPLLPHVARWRAHGLRAASGALTHGAPDVRHELGAPVGRLQHEREQTQPLRADAGPGAQRRTQREAPRTIEQLGATHPRPARRDELNDRRRERFGRATGRQREGDKFEADCHIVWGCLLFKSAAKAGRRA